MSFHCVSLRSLIVLLLFRERLQSGPSLPTSLLQGEQPSCLLSPSYLVCSSAPALSVALLWTLSSLPISLLNWGPKTGHGTTALASQWLSRGSNHPPDCDGQYTTLSFQLPLLWLSKTPEQQSCWPAYGMSHCLFYVHSFQLLQILCVCVAKVNLSATYRICTFG